jgi:site-specific recombinase XerD
MTDTLTVRQLVEEYDRYLVRRNRSPKTRQTYGMALDDFASYAEKHGAFDASSLAREHIEGWQYSLAHRNPRTRSLYGTALRQCLKWAAEHERPVTANLYMRVEATQVPDLVPHPLPMDDISKILAYFRSIQHPTPIDLRDRALFLCLVTTGARIGELLQMTRRDANRTSLVRQKGGKNVPITLIAPVRDAIAGYIAARRDDQPSLWVNLQRGKPVTPLNEAGVRELFRKTAQRAGVPRFTTHQLRHTAATRLFEMKVPESVITAIWIQSAGTLTSVVAATRRHPSWSGCSWRPRVRFLVSTCWRPT